MKKMKGILSVCLLAAGVAQADVVTIDDALAGGVGHVVTAPTGFGDNVALDRTLDAGIYANNYQRHPVFVFQMTGVTAPADITNANFSVSVTQTVGSFTFSADAHVIRKDANSTILASDYETTTQLLMSGFSESGDGVGTVSLDAAGQSTLTTWLQNNWVEGEYVFIGLKTDPLTLPDQNKTRVYRYGGTHGDAWSESSTDARLTIDVIPEPESLGLITAAGGAGLFIRH